MYQPSHFKTTQEFERDFLLKNPFGFLIFVPHSAGSLESSPLPFLWDSDLKKVYFHVATGNPLAKLLTAGKEVTLLFQGPQSYVSPTLYVTDGIHVPTWNYVVAEVRGAVSPVTEITRVKALMDRLVQAFEPEHDYRPDWTRKEMPGLLRAIRMFEIQVGNIIVKAKLSQNRDRRDRASVLSAFSCSDDPNQRSVAQWMGKI